MVQTTPPAVHLPSLPPSFAPSFGREGGREGGRSCCWSGEEEAVAFPNGDLTDEERRRGGGGGGGGVVRGRRPIDEDGSV